MIANYISENTISNNIEPTFKYSIEKERSSYLKFVIDDLNNSKGKFIVLVYNDVCYYLEGIDELLSFFKELTVYTEFGIYQFDTKLDAEDYINMYNDKEVMYYAI